MVSTMEGDGEGMVAIIEGLQDSGIAITVLNNRRYSRQRPRAYGTRKASVPKTKTSVKTSTDSFNRVNKGAQICDGRYASSYQLAHCHKVPTSPTAAVPEFPPQRAEPCRTQGNFELNGYGHSESYHRSHRSVSPLHSIRNGYILADTGAPLYASRSTWMDSFAHSLRRYPCLSPDLNMSTEFIQKLITYTQTKHHSKKSRQSQSMRSLLHERKKETISNRRIQSNVRTDHETPTKDDNNYNNIGQINESLKSNNVTTDFRKDKRNTRSIDDILDATYDYLKSNSPCRHPKTCEVKTMTKHVRETLKQIYSSKPMQTTLRICPTIQRRYEQHLRDHHSCGTGTLKPCTVSKANQIIDEHDASTQKRCSPSKNQSTLRKSCFCNKPVPCNCEQETPKLQNVSKTACKVNKGNKVDDGINEWLRDIPVSANESSEEKATRNAKIKQLADTLKGFNDHELNEKGREEIRKCIDFLPMWYPGDKREQNKFKEQLADKLLLKLNIKPKKDKECSHSHSAYVNNSKLETELLDTLEELLTKVEGDRKQELSQMARSLVDTLVKESRDNKTIEKTNKNKSENKKHEEIEDLLDLNGDKRKKEKECSHSHSAYVNNSKLGTELLDTLEKLLTKVEGDRKQELSQMARSLVDTLVKESRNNKTIENTNKNKSESNKHEEIENLLGLNGDKTKKDKECSHSHSAYVNNSKLGTELLDTLVNESRDTKTIENTNKNKSENKKHEEIEDLLGLNGDKNKKDKECSHSHSAYVNNSKLATTQNYNNSELLDTLEKLLTKVEGDRKQELSQTARSLVNTLVNESRDNKTIENTNKNKSENKKHEEIEDLLDLNGDKPKLNHRKRWDHHNNLPNAIAEEISQIIDREHAELSASKKQNLKDRIANVLGKNISNNKFRSSKEETNTLNKTRNSIDIESESLQYIVEKEIFNLLAEITGEDSVDLRNKRKVAFYELFCRIGDIVYDLNISEEDKINEVMKYLRNIYFPPEISKEQFSSELINRIRNSTSEIPRKKKRRISFNPEAESTRISTEQNRDLDLEKEILNEFSEIINNWIDDLLIDLNATEDTIFKETMVKDLASDFMDRLKYLQLNPGLKTTDQEELEHFKYQIFRWLNKLVPANDLYPILPKTQVLMDRLKQVDIPQFVQPSGVSMETQALENEISTWLKEIPPCLLKLSDSYNHKQMVQRLTDIIQQQRNNRNIDLNREIEQCLNEVVKDKQKLNHIVECLKNRLSYKGFIDDTGWSTIENTSQFIEESFEGDIIGWLKDLPLYQERNPNEKRMQEQLINELANDLKIIAENAQPGENIDKLFINEILKHLKQFPMTTEQKNDDQFHRNTAKQLLHYIKGLKTFQDISHSQRRLNTDEYFTKVIQDWLKSIPVNPRSSITEANLFAAIQEEFITRFKELHQQQSSRDDDQMLRKEIKEYLLLLPMDPSKKHDQTFLNDKVEELLRNLQEVLKEQVFERESKKGILKDQIFDIINDLSRKSLTGTDSKPGYKKPADILYDHIEDWCKSLPIYLGDSPADIEKVQTIKQNIASKLIKKVGELNMNPEIFNEDLLYEDLFQEEIENVLSSVPTNPELERSLPKLIRNLTKNVKEANHKARDELTGQVYKQQLKDSISKTLPLPSNISSQEQASFELLKDCVADAFINLHYVGNDEVLKNKYEKKIKDKVRTFCKDFMKRHPNIPMNSAKLNQDLYKALCNVSLPNEESIKSEVGQARIKDTINEWTKDLPLKDQTESEQLQQSKMISILAKRLNDLEKEESFNPEINNDEKIQKEIVKWIKKLPLKPGNDDTINNLAAKLVNDIRNTEKSRRFSGLQMRSDFMDSSYNNNNSSLIPPCTLSQEDSACLQRIRVRRPSISICKPQRNCTDVAISPCPVDSYTQTRIRPWCEIICNDKNESKSGKTDQQTQKSKASDSCVQSKAYEVSPKVIIREYQWDSTEELICPNQSQYKDYVQPVCKKNVGQNYVGRSPCTSFQPCLSPRSSIQNAGPFISQEKLPCTSTPKRPGMRRKRNTFPQPRFSIEPFGNSTGIEEDCTRNRRNKPRTLIDSINFTEEDDLLDGSCRSRISPITSDEELESMGRQRENNDEKVRYGCRDNTYTECPYRKIQTCPRMGGKEVKNCCHRCPHPSFLYFRK